RQTPRLLSPVCQTYCWARQSALAAGRESPTRFAKVPTICHRLRPNQQAPFFPTPLAVTVSPLLLGCQVTTSIYLTTANIVIPLFLGKISSDQLARSSP